MCMVGLIIPCNHRFSPMQRLGLLHHVADHTIVTPYAGMNSLIARLKLASRARATGRVTVAPLQGSSALVGLSVSAAASVGIFASFHTRTTPQSAWLSCVQTMSTLIKMSCTNP